MSKEFTIEVTNIDGNKELRTFKQVPAINGCEGCGGSCSDKVCLEISDYVADRAYKSCTGQGVIFVEVKDGMGI